MARVLQGDPARLEAILATRQAALEREIAATVATVGRIRAARADLAEGRVPAAEALSGLVVPAAVDLSFALPWPWGGETFELRGLAPVTYLVGPLGSGKTRLARAIADNLEDAHYLGLERLTDGYAQARLNEDPSLALRVEAEMARFVGTGASRSAALTALIVALEAPEAETLVVDMVEQGLDDATQKAVAAEIRRRAGNYGNHPGTRTRLVLMTRSSAILDPAVIGAGEAIILCPANHAPPRRIAAYPGAPGFEAVASCLASPEVRARTHGVIAHRPASSPEPGGRNRPVGGEV